MTPTEKLREDIAYVLCKCIAGHDHPGGYWYTIAGNILKELERHDVLAAAIRKMED